MPPRRTYFSPSHRVSTKSDNRQIFRGCGWWGRGRFFFLVFFLVHCLSFFRQLDHATLFFRNSTTTDHDLDGILHIILDAVNHLSAADPRAAHKHLINGSKWAPLSVSESFAWSAHTFWPAGRRRYSALPLASTVRMQGWVWSSARLTSCSPSTTSTSTSANKYCSRPTTIIGNR